MNSIAREDRNVSLLQPLRNWIENLRINRIEIAHCICQLIPAQCPFERDIYLGSQKLFHIPPLCKFNPLYEELVGLRFRALCYLADECGEDISHLLA
ncbi:MAG: Mo-dependent nitrogenase C-terminal domain-containing protein [Cyanobacteriota bacterium]|nr:Mo-dependent nitrogenase C-terminal domain-containing protein [Cyanobacteriota bacterium]